MLVAADRDGLAYRALSRLVYPVSSYFLRPPNELLSIDTEETFRTPPQSWSWFRKDLVSAKFADNGLELTPKSESVWWKNQRGALLYSHMAGDFDAQISVLTSKRSDRNLYPDQAFQFGGIMIRDPSGAAWLSRESYVFVAVGHRDTRLQIETKNTFNGYSEVKGTDWPSGIAQLRIVRHRGTVDLYARETSTDEWHQVDTTKTDLPDTVQLGVFSYAYSRGQGVVDLTAVFRDFRLLSAGKP